MVEIFEVYEFVTPSGANKFSEWLDSIKDVVTRARIRTRISRLRLGNFGDCKGVGGGVFELRMFFGPGYRVYFAKVEDRIVLLLAGGDKTSQQKDILQAKRCLQEFKKLMPVKDYKKSLHKDLQDPKFVVEYLNSALEEDSLSLFLLHLRDVADAHGGIGQLALQTDLAREAVYRMLSESGNPQFDSVQRILSSLGYKFQIIEVDSAEAA